MLTTSHRYQNLISYAIPSLIAVIISGIIDVEIFLHGPFDELITKLFKNQQTIEVITRVSWSFLQIFPAFIFGFISDHYLRKKMLIFSQVLGVLGGLFLWIFNFTPWVVFFIGLTFNPLSVARAAMLDNYPKVSAIKVISVTYIAKNISWIFIKDFSFFTFETVLYFLLPILFLNAIIMTIFQKDKFENKIKMEKIQEGLSCDQNLIKTNRLPIFLTLCGLFVAETTFYIIWIYLESDSNNPVKMGIHENWLSIIALATLLGTSFAIFYRKIPHFSIITILYSAGAGIMFITFLYVNQFNLSYEDNLMFAISHYCIIGGIYLPFVTDAFIEMAGSKRKAIGSAFSEMGDMIALFLASILAIFVDQNPLYILIVITMLYALAATLQRCSEQKFLHKYSIQ